MRAVTADRLDPTLAKLRTENEDPRCANMNADTEEPNREKLRTEMHELM
jgi:hypothetical protein